MSQVVSLGVLLVALAMPFSACGDGNGVPEGLEGLDIVKSRAERGLVQTTPSVAEAIETRPESAEGSYVETGYFGTTLLYGYDAEATFRTDAQVDLDVVRETLVGLDLEAGPVSDLPQDRRTITAQAQDHVVIVTLDDDGRTLVLKASSSGAEVHQRELPPARRAELREPSPIALP